MWPFNVIGSGIGSAIADVFDSMMRAIWNASLDLLRAAFTLADHFSVFTVSTTSGPIKILWPMMLWISAVLATGLFFWQLIMTNLQGGRGFLRLVCGPVQYGVALAVTVGVLATFLTGVDSLTNGILRYGLKSTNFTDAFNHTSIADAAGHGVKAAVLGLCAISGVFPSAVGYALEMLFREAAIYVLVATVPLVAAGLLANVTANWFWRTVRWVAVVVVMKPLLALTLVLGVAVAGGSQGVAGLLAGIGVLEISLLAPFALFRLFAFVDPRSDPGSSLRDWLSGTGVDSYGANNPVMIATHAMTGSDEQANVSRFDDALSAYTGESNSIAEYDSEPQPGTATSTSGAQTSSRPATSADAHDDGEGEDPPPPNDPGDGGGGPRPDTNGGGGPPHNGGPTGGAAGEAAEEAAVIL
ncbi:MAG TPA: hypothetical protein VFW65_11280 [Pseudonocardiaceae bacterium]|nr:hypothetical protein [Pseudonocardiaceae bacterium]